MEKAIEGLAIWGASKFIRNTIVKYKANKVINNLDMLQFGAGTGNEYRNVVITTKLLNFVVPALIGIGTAVGAAIAEFNGNHDTALLLLSTAIPHLAELRFNKRIVKENH